MPEHRRERHRFGPGYAWMFASLVAVVLALACAWLCVRIALSSRESAHAEFALLELTRPARLPALRELEDIDTTLVAALAWWPGNANALELVGRVCNLRADLQVDRDPSAQRALRARALDSLRRASALRPSWPYGQAELALVKASAGEFDRELVTAVTRARRFGSQEPRVLRQLAQVWLRGADRPLPELSSPLRQVLVDARSGVNSAFADRADRMGRGEELCALSGLPESARSRCRQLGWSVAEGAVP